jgi:hypothetical protein
MKPGTKAAAIRDVLGELGHVASFERVQERLKARGIKGVTPQQVSNEKRKLRERYDLEDLPVSVIKKVQATVIDVGSIDVVRRALDELEKLQARHE